jgi:hypothetical protein
MRGEQVRGRKQELIDRIMDNEQASVGVRGKQGGARGTKATLDDEVISEVRNSVLPP